MWDYWTDAGRWECALASSVPLLNWANEQIPGSVAGSPELLQGVAASVRLRAEREIGGGVAENTSWAPKLEKAELGLEVGPLCILGLF